jgi:Arc/MetJ-type ribon-helix-helix transcriptional regulator
MVTARMPAPLIKSVDSWAAKNADGSRSEAIRRLVELGLAGSTPTKHRSPEEAAKASDMAGRQIDQLANPAMPEEERRARKRRLIKGPREFRDMRGDQPKPKARSRSRKPVPLTGASRLFRQGQYGGPRYSKAAR